MRYSLSEADMKRFWEKVEAPSLHGCWTWKGSFFRKTNRPAFWLNSVKNNVLAYRVGYSLCIGELPEARQSVPDHQCNHGWCVNPWHLQITSNRDNVLRANSIAAQNKRKTTCKRGHPLVDWSKSGKHTGKGWRQCHICAMESQRRRRAATSHNSQSNETFS